MRRCALCHLELLVDRGVGVDAGADAVGKGEHVLDGALVRGAADHADARRAQGLRRVARADRRINEQHRAPACRSARGVRALGEARHGRRAAVQHEREAAARPR